MTEKDALIELIEDSSIDPAEDLDIDIDDSEQVDAFESLIEDNGGLPRTDNGDIDEDAVIELASDDPSRLAQSASVVGELGRRGFHVAKASAILPAAVGGPLLNVLPASWRIYHKINQWSAYQMQKASNADTLVNIRLNNGHEDIRPAAWTEPDEDEKDQPGYAVKGLGDKRFDPAIRGQSTSRYGKADMAHAMEDDTELASWAEPAIDNAIALGRDKYLFRSANVLVQQVNRISATDSPTGVTNGKTAVADGGVSSVLSNQSETEQQISIQQPGTLEDSLIPVSSRAGYDGQMVSWTQYQNLKKDQSGQETVREAKNRAWAAAKLDDIDSMNILKWMLIIGIWSAILLFHQDIGAAISGLTNNGSGGGAVGSALGTLFVLAGRR